MRSFAQVDVFTSRPGFGNPVAVVLDADGLSDDEMARLANWTNLSETTFVLSPSSAADYRVRIFTPTLELPFAGHPTLGTLRALLDTGRVSAQESWTQECGAGLVQIRRSQDASLSFAAPVPGITSSPLAADELGAILGTPAARDPLLIDIGPRWITGRISLAGLDSAVPDATAALAALDPRTCDGVTLYAVDDEKCVHVRSFFPGGGVLAEDPVCGSGNAAVAAHLVHTGRASDVPPTYQARQGRHRGRDGRITVTPQAEGRIWVGGPAVTVITGTISL
jgi:PhzF family phenazine biosynthesis protein